MRRGARNDLHDIITIQAQDNRKTEERKPTLRVLTLW
jgi:hypothetical protein